MCNGYDFVEIGDQFLKWMELMGIFDGARMDIGFDEECVNGNVVKFWNEMLDGKFQMDLGTGWPAIMEF